MFVAIQKKVGPLLRGALLLSLVAGCSALGPTGTNKANPVYTTPDADGNVVLNFPLPDGATKARFVLNNPPADVDFAEITDDSPDGADAGSPCEGVDGFCVSFTTEKLPANIYLMDVFIDDEEEPAGQIPFLVGAPAESTEEDKEASGTEE